MKNSYRKKYETGIPLRVKGNGSGLYSYLTESFYNITRGNLYINKSSVL